MRYLVASVVAAGVLGISSFAFADTVGCGPHTPHPVPPSSTSGSSGSGSSGSTGASSSSSTGSGSTGSHERAGNDDPGGCSQAGLGVGPYVLAMAVPLLIRRRRTR